jgi:hypothetical protein
VETYARLHGAMPDYPAVQAAATAAIAVHCARQAQSASRHSLWTTAAALETETIFGSFKIDPVSGAQISHDTTLVKWSGGDPHTC